jgi:hypothetical protein
LITLLAATPLAATPLVTTPAAAGLATEPVARAVPTSITTATRVLLHRLNLACTMGNPF